jgi:hypothetical protein
MVLGMAVAVFSTFGEATSKTIHVTARVVQTTFTGNPASPQLGDQRITTVDLLDQSGIRVGTGGGACTVVSIPPLDTLEQCLLTAAFADGQIIFGGLAHSPEVGDTDDFRNTRGEATLVVTTPEFMDVTFDLVTFPLD